MAKSYNPFSVFRKNQKMALAFITLLSMFAFVCVGPSLMGRGNNPSGPSKPAVLAKWDYGDITQIEVTNHRTWRVRINKFLTLLHDKGVEIGKVDADTRPVLFEPETEAGVLQAMVLEKKAELLGMSVSDASVNSFIDTIAGGTPKPDGTVSSPLGPDVKEELLRQAAGQSHLSDELFDNLRFELLARNFMVLLFHDYADYSTPAERLDYFSRLTRQATVQVVPVPVKDYVDKVPNPDNDELEKLFEEDKNRLAQPDLPEPGFMVPARGTFQYFKAVQTTLSKADEAKVTDKEIDDYYNKNKESFRKSKLDETALPSSGEKPKTEEKPKNGEQSKGAAPPKTTAPPKTIAPPKTTAPPKSTEQPKATEPPKAAEKTKAAETPKPEVPKNGEKAKSDEKPAPKQPPKSDEKSKSADAGKTPSGDKPKTDKPKTDKPKTDKPAADKSSNARPAIRHFGDDDLLALADTAPPASTAPTPAKTDAAPAAPATPAKDAAKGDAAKTDAAKAAAPKTEPLKTDTSKSDTTKSDTTKSDTTKSDTTKSDTTKSEINKSEINKSEINKTTPPKTEPAKTAPPATPAKTEPAKTAPAKTEPAKTETGKTPPTKTGAESSAADEFDPVTDPKVRSQIRTLLANQKAAGEINDDFKKLRSKVQNYGRAVSVWIGDGKPPADEPEAPDFKAAAKSFGFTFEATGALSAEEAAEQTELGKSMEFNEISRRLSYFPQEAYDPNLASYMPSQSMSPDGEVSYLWWRTDFKPAYVPAFTDAKSDVLLAWKTIQARKLATEQAKKYADDANKRLASLHDIFSNRANITVSTVGPFHWLTLGNVPVGDSMQPTVSLTRISGLDLAGVDFMRAVFTTDVGKTTVAFNQPQTIAYVVQVQKIEPPEEAFRAAFQHYQIEAANSQNSGQAGLAAMRTSEQLKLAKLRAIERDLGFKMLAAPAQGQGSTNGAPAEPTDDEGDY